MTLVVHVFFFQAEDGIRDKGMWLEFRRVLFRSGFVGATEPSKADKGTIRADFASEESYEKANSVGRALRNLIHASDSIENAEREISVWFKDNEIHGY